LLVSWESLERRKNEYRELVEKKIPANSKEIAVARSYGDLSENHEYKAAKEMQKLLMLRKVDLETQLVRARGTDFVSVRTDVASIGTIVQATDLATNQPEHFIILGAWDSDPEKDVVSYLSPVAQSLLGHKVGDEVEVEVHGVRHHHRLESIQPYKPAEASPGGAVPASQPPAQ
jgi:transcription elongation GreA/GreB family factor